MNTITIFYKIILSIFISIYSVQMTYKYKKFVEILSITFLSLICFIIFYFFYDISYLLVFTIIFLIFLIKSNITIALKIEFSTTPIILLLIINIYSWGINLLLPNSNYNHIYLTQKMAINYIIQLLIYEFLLIAFIKQSKKAISININYWPTCIYSSILLIILLVINKLCLNSKILSITIFIIILSLSIFTFLMIYIQSVTFKYQLQKEKDEYENSLLQQELKLNKEYLQSQEELHNLKHDVQHLLNTLSEAEDKETKSNIENKLLKISHLPLPFDTGNNSIDTILSIKKDIAITNDISFICTINITENVPIENDDLSLLMINLLDNAIQHIGTGKRIEVTIKNIGNNLLIKVSNSIDALIKMNTTDFTIPYASNDKYGIKTICKIVKKYNGIINYKQSTNILTATIIIPISK